MSYKINIDREKLSETEIQNNMNFDTFLKGYKAVNSGWFLNGIKYYTIIGASGVVLLGGYLAYQGFMGTQKDNSLAPFINPPIKGADVKASVFIISADNDTCVVYKTGSSIQIPTNAFLDKEGKPVTGKVELRYREFHDPFEIMLSGIPMHYDSAGQHYQFESAGMLEVLAYKDGELLFTNPEAPIKINMLSNNNEDKFNIYYLDTVKKGWEYIGKNSLESGTFKPLFDSAIARNYLQEAIKEAEMQMPQKLNSSRYNFVIDYNKNEFPELAMFDDVKFEVDKSDKDYSPKYAQKTWSDVSVSRQADKKHYTILFSNENESHSFTAMPVLEGKDYEKAKQEMEMKLIDYKIALQKRQLTDREENELIMSNYQKLIDKAEWQDINKEVKEYVEENRINYVQVAMRTFTVRSFGAWNFDWGFSIAKRDKEYPLCQPSFTSTRDKTLSIRSVYVYEKNTKILWPFVRKGTQMPNFRVNRNSDNIMVAITTDGFPAYMNETEFKQAMLPSGDPVFKLHLVNKKIDDPAELRALLNM